MITFSRSDRADYQGLVPTASRDWLGLVLNAFAASAFAAVILGYVSLFIMRAVPRLCIHGAMILNLAVLAITAIVMGIKVAWYWGLLFALSFVLWGFLYWSMIPFIPFLAELLVAVAGLVMQYPSTIILNFVSVVLQFAWIMLYSYVSLLLQSRYGRGGVIGLTTYMLLSFFWTLQMLKNLVHTTNCGVFATWYFMNHTNAMPERPMMGALKRTFTTSFGSVAFGSLIVAIIQTLKALANFRMNNSNGQGGDCANIVMCVLAGIAHCILSCLESIAMYINHYAFVIVATYGQSYIEAGKTALDMFMRTGFINLLNDNMLNRLEFAVCLLNSLIIMFCSSGFTLWMGLSTQYMGLVAGCTFFSAFLITSLIMQTLESAAATIYVCFAQDSAALARTNPVLYERITSTFGGELIASAQPV